MRLCVLYPKAAATIRGCRGRRVAVNSSLPFSSLSRPSNNDGKENDKGPIRSFVEKQIEAGALRRDEEQLCVASKLDDLRMALMSTDSKTVPAEKLSADLFTDSVPKGMIERAKAFAKQQYLDIKLGSFSVPTPRGLYIHGSVGVGKSFLMDTFADSIESTRRGVRRVHFHEFMLDVHERIHKFKKENPKADPLPSLAL